MIVLKIQSEIVYLKKKNFILPLYLLKMKNINKNKNNSKSLMKTNNLFKKGG